MFSRIAVLYIITLLLISSCQNGSGQMSSKEGTPTDSLAFAPHQANLILPEGFQVVKVAQNIGAARRIVIRQNGDMYVSLNSPHNGHPLVAMRDTTGDGQADIIKYFAHLSGGTGLRLYNGYLYFGSDTAVVRFKLKSGQLLPVMPAQPVAALPKQYQHSARSLAFDDQGHMYVNIGAPSNSCQEHDRTKGSMGMQPCPLLEKYGGIWQFDANTLHQTKKDDGIRYATGLRNCVAMDWNASTGELYALMHGRDQLHQNFPEYYTVEESAKLPAERFMRIKKGGNYGWPYVYWDPFKAAYMVAPEYGGNGEEQDHTNKYEKPIMDFPAHWAPNGLLFYTGNQFPKKYHHGAFIAFHGSWNRAPEPQKGYKVVFVPFDGNSPSGNHEVFADGFAGISGPIQSPGQAKHRPCGLGQGPDGSLYITDDKAGSIYRVVYTGQNQNQ